MYKFIVVRQKKKLYIKYSGYVKINHTWSQFKPLQSMNITKILVWTILKKLNYYFGTYHVRYFQINNLKV